jgi:hypothetical protein
MQIIKTVQKDKLIYWPYAGADQYGQPIYGAPSVITCRWDECLKQVFDADGSPVFSKIELITQIRLAPKGLIKKGTTIPADPSASDGETPSSTMDGRVLDGGGPSSVMDGESYDGGEPDTIVYAYNPRNHPDVFEIIAVEVTPMLRRRNVTLFEAYA